MTTSRQIQNLVLILLLFGLASKSFGNNFVLDPIRPNPNWNRHTPWLQLKTKHFVFILPQELTDTAGYLQDHANQYDHMYERIQHFFPDIEDSIPVFLEHRSTTHNGSAGVVPLPLITIFLTPPNFASELGQSLDYISEALRHELAHMAHFSVKSSTYKFFSRIFGTVVTPATVTPRWVLEGFAVWVETIGSYTGRGRSTVTQGQTELLAQSWPALSDMTGTSLTYPGGNRPYLFGYLFFEYLDQMYGKEKIFKYITLTGHTFPAFYDVPAKEIFGKPIHTLWEDAHQFFLKTTGTSTKLKTQSELQTLTPLTRQATLRGTVALDPRKTHVYYWESHPYGGRKLIQHSLSAPYTSSVVHHLSSSRSNHAAINTCMGSLYATQHHVSQSGANPTLVRWNFEDQRFEDLNVNLGIYGKTIDMACSTYQGEPTLILLMFYDMGYNILAYQKGRLHPIGYLPYISGGAFPTQAIDHPQQPHLLMFNPINQKNEIWILSQPIQKHSLEWTHRRRLHKLTYDTDQKIFWGICDAMHGRSICQVNKNLMLMGEHPLDIPLPIEVTPIDPHRLLLQYASTSGDTVSIWNKPPTQDTSFSARHSKIIVPHLDPHPWPALQDSRLNPIAKAKPILDKNFQPYSASSYAIPRYWRPLLDLSTLSNPGLGFLTHVQDPTMTFSYQLQSVFEVNPFSVSALSMAEWATPLAAHGPLLTGSYSPSGKGPELLQTSLTGAWLARFKLHSEITLFISGVYEPAWNLNSQLRHLISVPVILQYQRTWGDVLYPYGWAMAAETEFMGGTLFSIQNIRAFNADPGSVGYQRSWHLGIKPALNLKVSVPLFIDTMGIHQSLLYVAHQWSAGDLGPVDFDIFRPRPTPSLTTNASTPFHTSVITTSHHMFFHKFRPFILLAQADKGILFLPLFLQDLWLEGIFDTGYFVTLKSWMGSVGAQLTSNFEVFFHQTTAVKIFIFFPWANQFQVDKNNFNVGVSFNIPFPF